ncbi:MAG: ferritin-like domain-containing protein [Longimicrobiales bacterium]
MALDSLEKLFVQELRDLYHAEKQILRALPRMAKATEHEELRGAFEQHRQQTAEHVGRLERIFGDLDVAVRGKQCKGMEGIIEEGKEILEEDADPDVRDAALIAAAQRVEHYEIAAYGTVRTYAERLGHDNAARLLQQTLDEEGETDKKLTQIAERVVNPEAQRV